MPYERWILADTLWVLSLIVFPLSAKTEGYLQAGVVAALIAYLWWRHRETRKADWFAEQERQIRLRSFADIDDEANR